MNHPALDAYLDELLDLTVDAVSPAPVAANAPVMAVADEPVAIGAASTPLQIDAGLLAELDADPLFVGQAPAEVEAPSLQAGAGAAEASVMSIDPGLLAELDSDPLFAAAMAATPVAPAASAESLIDPGLLAELDSDPLFAAAMASTPVAPAASSESLIDPGLLAELDSDPLFGSPNGAEASSLAVRAEEGREASHGTHAPGSVRGGAVDSTPPHPSPARRGAIPQVRNAAPSADPRSGLRPVEMGPPALPPSVTTTHRWLRVAVGEDSYAVELLRVQEVGRTVPIVAMRGAAPSVLGAMNLRGRIVPVFDLGLWLGTGRVTPDERARIVVVERDNELIGALVSAVDDVVTLGPDRIEPPLMASPSRAIVGVARVVAKPTVLLDANALFG